MESKRSSILSGRTKCGQEVVPSADSSAVMDKVNSKVMKRAIYEALDDFKNPHLLFFALGEILKCFGHSDGDRKPWNMRDKKIGDLFCSILNETFKWKGINKSSPFEPLSDVIESYFERMGIQFEYKFDFIWEIYEQSIWSVTVIAIEPIKWDGSV